MMRYCACLAIAFLPLTLAAAEAKPNILWLTSEDHGPHLGCYGFDYAQSPHVDDLAKRGLRFVRCWSNAPVCAPARTTIITGLYPPSTGSEHMRSMTVLPQKFVMYPALLRQAGYYCTNNSKEDYNLKKPAGTWDESSNKAHWKNRAAGQPFFAIFNATASHESQLRGKATAPQHDPAQAPLPQYHPDLPEVRQEWAHYHDNITKVDAEAGRHLRELADAGLADDTIIFYYADHGSGMPRGKRMACNSGLHVPLVVYFPEKFKHLAPAENAPGKASTELISFVDLAPTLLSIAGVQPPDWMQGVAFAGKFPGPPRKYLFGFRGRMDERYDLVRSVTEGRFVYVRNFYPHLPHGQHVAYQFQTATTRLWKELYDQGKLTPEQATFWQRRQPEELYDLQSDPDEVHNLASSAKPEHQQKLAELRQALRDHTLAIRDVGFLPEDEIHARSRGSSPYEYGHDLQKYPLERILTMAELASSLRDEDRPALVKGMQDDDSAVRFWAAMGMLMRGKPAVAEHSAALTKLLDDPGPSVRMAAAAALAEHAEGAAAERGLKTLVALADVSRSNLYVGLQALNALDNLGLKAASAKDAILALPSKPAEGEGRVNDRVPLLLQSLHERFGGGKPAASEGKKKKK